MYTKKQINEIKNSVNIGDFVKYHNNSKVFVNTVLDGHEVHKMQKKND